VKLGVLISGRGSNMLALARACAAPEYPAEIALVVSNEPDAPGLSAAADLGLATAVVEHRDYDGREPFEWGLVNALRTHGVELVALAGFMRLLGSGFLEAFPQRVLNIHPSLLPAFPGLHAHEQALAYGVRYSGCTVHLVTEDMDAGPILLQAAVPVQAHDTAETLAARVLEHEHRIYPEAVRLVAEQRVRVVGRLARVAASSTPCTARS